MSMALRNTASASAARCPESKSNPCRMSSDAAPPICGVAWGEAVDCAGERRAGGNAMSMMESAKGAAFLIFNKERAWNWRWCNPRVLLRHANLFRAMNNNFRAPLVRSDGSMNLNDAPGESSEIAKFGFVRREDDAGEWTVAIVLAEIEKSVAAARSESAEQAAGDAARLA